MRSAFFLIRRYKRRSQCHYGAGVACFARMRKGSENYGEPLRFTLASLHRSMHKQEVSFFVSTECALALPSCHVPIDKNLGWISRLKCPWYAPLNNQQWPHLWNRFSWLVWDELHLFIKTNFLGISIPFRSRPFVGAIIHARTLARIHISIVFRMTSRQLP